MTAPTNDEIMEVLGLTHTSTEMMCDRLRALWEPAPVTTLGDMEKRVYEINVANGWFDDERAFGDDIALLHSEVSEMFEAYRDHGFEDVTQHLCKQRTDNGWHDEETHLCKPEGFGSECADVLVRFLDSNKRLDFSIPYLTLADVPTPTEGFRPERTVGDHIRTLHAYIARVDSFSGNHWSVLAYLKAWCDHLEIDLEAEFERKLAYNATRDHKHGGKRV